MIALARPIKPAVANSRSKLDGAIFRTALYSRNSEEWVITKSPQYDDSAAKNAPADASATPSATHKATILLLLKPNARSTPSSRVRSLIDIAIEFAEDSAVVNNAAMQMA
jgi:hypothetical protein